MPCSSATRAHGWHVRSGGRGETIEVVVADSRKTPGQGWSFPPRQRLADEKLSVQYCAYRYSLWVLFYPFLLHCLTVFTHCVTPPSVMPPAYASLLLNTRR